MSIRQTILDGMLALGVVALIVANRPGAPSYTYDLSPNASHIATSSPDRSTTPHRDYVWDGEGWVVR
jgi:hypothetical protein